jgi:hypothetical protein
MNSPSKTRARVVAWLAMLATAAFISVSAAEQIANLPTSGDQGTAWPPEQSSSRIPGHAGPVSFERQERSDSKPRVGATRLPWVKWPESSQPQRGCGPIKVFGHNPVGVDILCFIQTQGSLRQPWAGGQNAVGVPRKSAMNLGAADRLDRADQAFLVELARTGCLYFWENADARTGLVKDRSRADGPDERTVGSIAATGFGLTALCLAHEHRWLPRSAVEERVRETLRFLRHELPAEHGFFYHFVDVRTGERAWKCEVSSIDTGLLLCGVLTCRQYFRDKEIRRLAGEIYERVDWTWLLTTNQTLGHGWKPEGGMLKNDWDSYCELMLLYLLAMGSPTHAIPADSWRAWRRPWAELEGLRFISAPTNAPAPLFVHQYSHAWFDFRGQRDAWTNYFENSVAATEAHRRFCSGLPKEFAHFGEGIWGITASDSSRGYVVWGGPPAHGPLDGTVVPCAAAGSLPFLPRESLRALRLMRERWGARVWGRNGFVDAFNPATGWVNRDVIGIDVGITVLMAENARNEWVWKTFMKNAEMEAAMRKAGFQPDRPARAQTAR